MPRTNHGLWNWLGCLTLLPAVGCHHTKPQPAPFVPPPQPGWGAAPAPGCSSCGANSPTMAAPRYAPPMPASPPIVGMAPGGITLGTPVHAHSPDTATPTAFQPPPLDAKLGGALSEEGGSSIPLPPSPPENTPALVTKR